MKLPRNLTGAELIRALRQLGYSVTRQTGSHVRLTSEQPSQHHITVPLHDPLRIGTLAAILSDIAVEKNMSRDELLAELFK